MIDTDKYEGHTPTDAWRHADGSVNYMPPMNNKADAELAADAPLLLAEVKRLREEIKRIARRMMRGEKTYSKDLLAVIE